MMLVYICSPYKGSVEYNTSRVQRYCRFAYSKGYVPYAPHLHNPSFLDETIPEEREAGIKLGLQLLKRSGEVWVFGNRISEGMQIEIAAATDWGIPVKYFTDRCEEREVNRSE